VADSAMQSAPDDPIEAMLYGLQRLPEEVQNKLNSEALLDELMCEIEDSPELKAACEKHAPEQRRNASGKRTIDPEEALLSYHQMRHERSVLAAKTSMVAAREQLRQADKSKPEEMQARGRQYEMALHGLLDVAVLDFKLTRLDSLIEQMVTVGSQNREAMLKNKLVHQNRVFGTINLRSNATMLADKAKKVLQPCMDLNKARWQARVFVDRLDPSSDLLRLVVAHGGKEFQALKELQAKHAAAQEKFELLGRSKSTRSDVRKQARARDQIAAELQHEEVMLGIKVADLDVLADKVVMADDARMREHLLGWGPLQDELEDPQVRALYGQKEEVADADVAAASAKVLDVVLSGSSVEAARANDAAQFADKVAPAAHIALKKTTKYTSYHENSAEAWSTPAILSGYFRGDEHSSMVERCNRLELGGVCHLMKALTPEYMEKKAVTPNFPVYLGLLLRRAVDIAEKDPVFCKKLKSVAADKSWQHSQPAAAEHALHRIEMMLRAAEITQGAYDQDPEALADEITAQFRFAMLPVLLCARKGLYEEATIDLSGRSRCEDEDKNLFNGDPQGLPLLTSYETYSEHRYDFTPQLLRIERDTSLGLRLNPHFEIEPLAAENLVKLKKFKSEAFNDRAFQQAYAAHQHKVMVTEEHLDQLIADVSQDLLGAGVETFMNWAEKYPPLDATLRRMQPEVYRVAPARKSSDDPDEPIDTGLDKAELTANLAQVTFKVRKALGEFFKEQGTFKALSQGVVLPLPERKYPTELKLQVVTLVKEGHRLGAIAKEFGVPYQTLKAWVDAQFDEDAQVAESAYADPTRDAHVDEDAARH
jgi:CENP-B N-terminal DNA-binding domain